MTPIEPTFHMWVTFAMVVGALVLYGLERVPMEVTSLGVVCALLLFFHLFPVPGPGGANSLAPERILMGFANPALIAVLALLVMGHGIVRTGLFDRGARLLVRLCGGRAWLSVVVVLVMVTAVSAFLNNTPVVLLFMPIMQALARRFGRSVSALMMPLSFAGILGGMTTLIGSSTNLLVNGVIIGMAERPFGFFDFSVPGLVLAGVGLVYVAAAVPRMLPDRASLKESLLDGRGKQFIAQLTLSPDSKVVGSGAPAGAFANLPEMTVRMVQRGELAILPPFEGLSAEPGDVLVVAATRTALAEAVARDPGLLYPGPADGGPIGGDDEKTLQRAQRMLAEAMVAPASSLIGQTLRQIEFRHRTNCIVVGIQRRARMIRAPMTEIPLEAGDVLLLLGRPEDVEALKTHRDVVLIEWSAEELPALTHAPPAAIILLLAVGFSAAGIMPIEVAALTGAAAMVIVGVLNPRQAFRAVDPQIATTIVATLGLGLALQETGGAAYLARALIQVIGWAGPVAMLSLFFLLVAAVTNVISNNACAVLFTPIAVDLARRLGVPPEVFAVAVIFASNCSFASPLGYQTNMMVMGPGHYRFVDFARAGTPLIVLLWLAFTLFVPFYYGL